MILLFALLWFELQFFITIFIYIPIVEWFLLFFFLDLL